MEQYLLANKVRAVAQYKLYLFCIYLGWYLTYVVITQPEQFYTVFIPPRETFQVAYSVSFSVKENPHYCCYS